MSKAVRESDRGGVQIWREAQAHLRGLDDDYDRAAALHLERYSRYPPDAFHTSPGKRRMKVRQAFGGGYGWASRLFGSLDRPHLYTLKAKHLGLEEELEAAGGFYQHDVVRRWVEALRAQFEPPLWWRLELGNGVHIHVIAAWDAGLMHLSRGGEVVKPIYDPEGLLAYLMKPSAAYTRRNLALWLEARARGRLPRTSGTIGVPNRRSWRSEC